MKSGRAYCIHALVAVMGLTFSGLAVAEDWHERARSLLQTAVNVPTVEGRGRVPELAGLIADQYRAAGFAADDVQILPYAQTAALIVRWRAAGHVVHKPILLLAHLDVVEARKEDWGSDPFTMIEKDGYFYGRGVLDDKVGVVGVTLGLLKLQAEGFKPRRDIVVLFTGDEETAGEGAVLGARDWRRWTDAEYALNADAGGGAIDTSGRVLGFSLQAAEKTSVTLNLTVHNRGGHSSKPRADNAIYELASALKRLESYRFTPVLNETTRAYFSVRQKGERGELGDAMRRWLANEADGAAADTIEADPREVGMTRTTCVATRLEAGHADNALAQTARAIVNCRSTPGVTPEKLRTQLKDVVGDPAIEIEVTQVFGGAPGSVLRDDVMKAYAEAVHRRFPGAPIIPEMSTGGSDGAAFRAAGIPTYGVQGTWIVVPDDMRMHGLDERLPVKALFDNVDHWHDLIAALAGS